MTSDPPRPARPAPFRLPGAIDTTTFAESRWARLATLAVALALVVALNVWLNSPAFWHRVQTLGAARYAAYHPVALQLPGVMAPPDWVRGGTAVLGSSTVGASLPEPRTEQRLGRRAWTVWASGVRPPEFLAMAPYVVRGKPRHVLIALEARMASLSGETPFSAKNRQAYVGPLSPAWAYHARQSHLGWAGRLAACPAVRLREPLRVLFGGYVREGLIRQRLPDANAWRQIENFYATKSAQDARAAYQAEPTIERYQAYLDVVGVTHEGIRVFWTQMRNAPADLDGTGDNVTALMATTQYLQDRGIRVSWFLYPENPICAQLRGPDGAIMAPQALQGHAQQLFRRLAEREHIPYLDLLHLAPPEDFVDYTHLAPPASDRLGLALRPLLEAADAAQSATVAASEADTGAAVSDAGA